MKRFQSCLNANSSNQFLYFRAIQGHSGDNAVDLELQDNVLLPKGFPEYIYHVGNASELSSTIRNELIPGRKHLKRGRQAVCFTTVNPMEDGNGMEKNSTRLDETEDRTMQEYTEALSKYSMLVQFEARSREKLANFTKHCHIQWFSTTLLLAACIEKAVCMKTLEELYQKIRLIPRVPRVVLKSNSQYGQQDLRSQTQYHFGTHQAIQKVTGGATP